MSARNVLGILKEDHARVKKLLEEFAETTDRGVKVRRELLDKITMELEIHTQLEEELFYPAYKHAVETKEDRKLFFEAAEEHALVKETLKKLAKTKVESEEFGARAKVLKDLVEHHAREEENDMFPAARKAMGEELLSNLAQEVEARRDVLKKEMAAK